MSFKASIYPVCRVKNAYPNETFIKGINDMVLAGQSKGQITIYLKIISSLATSIREPPFLDKHLSEATSSLRQAAVSRTQPPTF